MGKYGLITMQLPPLGTNCYLLINTDSHQAAVIDPAGDAGRILREAEQAGAEICMIIDTHGHWDHIGANAELAEVTGAPILIHELDAPMLTDASLSLARNFGGNGVGGKAARLLHDGDQIALGKLCLHVLHTPGHTPGGICLLCEDLLFCGDTLFRLSCGRCDLPGGDEAAMRASLAHLAALPGDRLALPGHGPSTRLDDERRQNPYMPRG